MDPSDRVGLDLEDLTRDVVWLQRLARRLVADRTRADDLAQSTWVVALRRAAGLERPTRSWLGWTLRNLARVARRDDARRLVRERRAARDEVVATPSELDGAGVDGVSDADDLALLGQRHLLDAVLRLPEAQRRVLILRYWRDASPTEIAAQLGESAGAVKGRLRRALETLREHVADRDEGADGARLRSALVAFVSRPVSQIPSPRRAVAAARTPILVMKKLLVMSAVAILGVLAILVRPLAHERPTDDRLAVSSAAALEERPETELARAATGPLRVQSQTAGQWDVDRAYDLHGLVVNAAGAPIPGAIVRVLATRWNVPRALWTEDRPSAGHAAERVTDELGRFQFRLEGGAQVDVMAEAEGLGRASVPRCLAGERVVLRLTSARVLRGRVTVDGAPVEGADVTLGPEVWGLHDPAFEVARARSNADGQYELRGLATGKYRVKVTRAGFVSPTPVPVAIGPEDGVLDLALQRGRALRGVVLDAATGAPIADGLVTASLSFTSAEARTDATGRFELTGVAARPASFSQADLAVRLTAHADGYVTQHTSLEPPPGDSDYAETELRLVRGVTLHGRLVTEDRTTAFPDARVVVFTKDRGVGWHRAMRATGVVELDGSFRIPGVAADLDTLFEVEGSNDLQRKSQSALIVEAQGQTRAVWLLPRFESEQIDVELGTLVVGHPAALAGRVVDDTGAPVADASLRITTECGWWGKSLPEVRGVNGTLAELAGAVTVETDDLGRFVAPSLRAGNVSLAVELGGGGARATRSLALAAGERREGVEVTLDTRGRIAGRVVDENQNPILRAVVMPRSSDRQRAMFATGVDNYGCFSLVGLGDGPIELEVWEPDTEAGPGANLSRTLGPVEVGTQELEVELPPAAVVRGVVRGADGAPLRYPRVELALEGGRAPLSCPVDIDGRFWFAVPRGVKLDVWVAPMGSPRADLVRVAEGLTADGSWLELQR